jgi:ribosomal protein S18 acetylase RimI-like enzyme
MKRQEMDLAINWAKNEGWNPGRRDANSFYNADPSGFFVGFLSDVPVGCISAVTYGKTFGFLGLYIIRPEYRGKGYGIQLWEHALKHLGARNIGLDGVLARRKDYEKYGFNFAYLNLRYGGNVTSNNVVSRNVVNLDSFSIDDILEYDNKMFPAPRRQFLEVWLRQKGARALGYVSQSPQSAGKLSGYGVIRPCAMGHKIGPLFADNEQIVKHLFSALTKDTEKVFVDIPEGNTSALKLVKRMGMEQVFETARMYNSKVPDLPIDRIFGVTTLELG